MRQLEAVAVVHATPQKVYQTVLFQYLPKSGLASVVRDDPGHAVGGGFMSALGLTTVTLKCEEASTGTKLRATLLAIAPVGELKFRLNRAGLERSLQSIVDDIKRVAES